MCFPSARIAIKASQLARTKNGRPGRPLQRRGFRSRTRPLVFHGPGTRTTGTSGRNATSTSAVTAMPNAHFTSSPITSHPSARTCRSAHMRPRSLPRISRSQHPPADGARSLYTPSTRAAAASLVLQSASPDSSSQLVTDQIGGSAPRPPRCSRRPRPTPWATWTSPASTTSACAPKMCRSAPTASSSAAAASYRCSRAGSSPSG